MEGSGGALGGVPGASGAVPGGFGRRLARWFSGRSPAPGLREGFPFVWEPVWGGSWGSIWGLVGVIFGSSFRGRFGPPVGTDFGPDLGPNSGPKSTRERSQDEHRCARPEKLEKCTPPTRNAHFGSPRRDRNQPQTAPNASWKRYCTQDRDEDPKMRPTGANLGSRSAPKSAPKRFSNGVEVEVQFQRPSGRRFGPKRGALAPRGRAGRRQRRGQLGGVGG